MPAHYTHYRFGAAALGAFPADVRRTVQRFRRLYDAGLHGPDLFYYQNALRTGTSGALGIKYHEQTGRNFFTRACRSIRLARSEAALAYLYGVLCHFVLDSRLHDCIRALEAETEAGHAQLESEFERFLLEQDGILPPNGQRLTAHLTLTDGECETVAGFYPPATAKTVRNALDSSVRAVRMLMTPEGPGRFLLEKGLSLLGRGTAGMLLRTKPDPLCSRYNEVLLEQYGQALESLPEYLQQLNAHLTYSAPLDGEFERTFG